MNKNIEGKILDIAAAIIVSPLAAYAKAVEIKETVIASETYDKTKEAAKSAGKDIKKAAKKAYESDPVQKSIGAAKNTVKKVSDSDVYQKAKEGAEKGVQAAKDGVKGAMTRLGFGKESEAEDEEGSCCSGETEECGCETESEESSCCETESEESSCSCEKEEKDEDIEEVIDEVDLSDIITPEDVKEDIPQ